MPNKKQEVDINIKIDLATLSNHTSKGQSEKVVTTLTVAQIAYLIKLLFDTNVISASNKSEVLTRLTNCMVTKNAREISPKSLKAKFYSADPGTKISTKRLLEKLLDSIEVYE